VTGSHDGDEIRVPMLMYHSIAADSSPQFRPFAVTPTAFAAQMAALESAGHTALTVSDFTRLATGPSDGWPERPVVLTFDDAFSDFYETALPILQSHHFRATLYVPTRYIGSTSRWLSREGEGRRSMMTWSALHEVSDSQIEIGSHSISHPQLDLLSPDEAVREVTEPKHVLEQQLQVAVDSFAYPFGYWSPAVRRLVKDAGYVSACAVRDLSSSSTSDPYTLSRWTVPFGMGSDELLSVLDRRSGAMAHLRSGARSRVSKVLRRSGLKRRGETEPTPIA
jgi:peptidoglycan/xylan/chitin deacetylase (PgdA/CDA1 family)